MLFFKPCFDLLEHTLQYTYFVLVCLFSYTWCLLQCLGKVMGGVCVLHGLILLSILFSLKCKYLLLAALGLHGCAGVLWLWRVGAAF